MKRRNWSLFSRVLSMALAVLMMLSCGPAVMAADGDDCAEDGCSGTYTNGFCSADATHYEEAKVVSDTHHAELNATHSGYYAIENAGQLYWFAALVNSGTVGSASGSYTKYWSCPAKAVLTDDIVVNTNVLSASGEPNSGDFVSWTPIGYGKTPNNEKVRYTGTFDGNGKTVSGLYVNGYSTSSSTGMTYVGLIGFSGGATVKNVTLEDSFISGYDWVGGIVGDMNSGTMKNCVNKATVKGLQNVGGVTGGCENAATFTNCRNDGLVLGSNKVGGFAGTINYKSKVTNCGNTATVKWISGSRGYFGGFVGYSSYSSPTYENCYNTGAVIYESTSSFQDYVGGFVGSANYGTFTNCYSSGTITVTDPDHYVGGFAAYAWSSNTTFTNSYYNTDSVETAIAQGTPATTPTGADTDDFVSGKVTWLLNGETSEGTLVWGQNIDGEGEKDAAPVLGGPTVYEVTEDTLYSNSPEGPKPVEPAITQKGRNLSYEDMIYVIDVFELTGIDLSTIDLSTDAGLLIWTVEEFEALSEIAYDEAHANAGLKPYQDTDYYYGWSDGIFTRDLHEDAYYVGYVKLADGTYIYSAAEKYSPAIYAYKMLENSESEETKALCVALLNYISAAQKYFYTNVSDADLVNKDLTAEQKALNWNSPAMNLAPAVPADKQVTRDTAVFTGTGKNLLFEEMISLVSVYKVDTAVVNAATECGTIFWTVEQFEALTGAPSVDNIGEGTKVTGFNVYQDTDGQWYSVAPEVAAKDMSATSYYILGYVIDADGTVHYSGVMSYSFEQYINNTVTKASASAAMIEFAQRLYIYERAAQAALG